MPRVIVAGGSLGGLTAALVLRDAGCDVRVFERSPAALTARGAGIAALDTTLAYLVRRGGLPTRELCSATEWIRFLNRDGSVRHEQRHRYLFSSWNTIYRSLLEFFDAERYMLGAEVADFLAVPAPRRIAAPTIRDHPFLARFSGRRRHRKLPNVDFMKARFV